MAKLQNYTNNDISMSEVSSSNVSNAEKICAKYPVGKKVTVYYNSDDPSDSLLEPGLTWINYIPVVSAIAFIFFGALLVLTPLVKGVFLLLFTVKG